MFLDLVTDIRLSSHIHAFKTLKSVSLDSIAALFPLTSYDDKFPHLISSTWRFGKRVVTPFGVYLKATFFVYVDSL